MNTKDMMEFGQRRFNPIMGVMSPTTVPYAKSGSEVTQMLRSATNNVDVRANGGDALSIRPVWNPNAVPYGDDSRLMRAVRVCEAVKSDNCSAFDDPAFAKDCLLSHETGGFDSAGAAHMGGFVLFEEERNRQLESAGSAFPNFRANAGTLPPAGSNYAQRVSYDKASCEVVKQRIKCEMRPEYGTTEQCGRCEDGGGRSYSLATTTRSEISIMIVGRGNYIINGQSGLKLGEGNLTEGSASEIRLPSDSEGKKLQLLLTGGSNIYVAGYLQGSTANGYNRTDLRFLTALDSVSKAKPSIAGLASVKQSGALEVSTEKMAILRPGIGKTEMNIDIYIPYTFIESDQPLNYFCTNAPFTTSEKSATFLGKDPCYARDANRPGQQKLSCLQDIWTRAGCTAQGNDYPGTNAMADKLRTVNGAAQSVGDISQAVYDKAIRARLGQNPDGSPFTGTLREQLRTWDTHSQSCLGIKRDTPCDKYEFGGPVGDDCLEFLYNDEGRHIGQYGPTYTTKEAPNFASLKGKMIMREREEGKYVQQQCTPSGTANPMGTTETSIALREAARAQGSIDAVKNYYDSIHAKANSTRMTDSERATYLKQCYGITLVPDSRLTE